MLPQSNEMNTPELSKELKEDLREGLRGLVLKGDFIGLTKMVNMTELNETDRQLLLKLATEYNYDDLLEVLS